jgi:hypothetical protein
MIAATLKSEVKPYIKRLRAVRSPDSRPAVRNVSDPRPRCAHAGELDQGARYRVSGRTSRGVRVRQPSPVALLTGAPVTTASL